MIVEEEEEEPRESFSSGPSLTSGQDNVSGLEVSDLANGLYRREHITNIIPLRV